MSDLYEGIGDVEITIHVIRASGSESIVDQYIRFCEIADEERKNRGYTKEAVEETIRRCIAENVLTKFLLSRQQEVQDIMFTLFDHERIVEIHEYNIAKDARAEGEAKGLEKGMEKGMEKGKAESRLEIAKNLLSIQIPYDQIAKATGLSLAEVERLAV